jgi:hypothetical protein
VIHCGDILRFSKDTERSELLGGIFRPVFSCDRAALVHKNLPERHLRRKIRFLLPPALAILLMLGYAMMCADWLAVPGNGWNGVLPVLVIEALLLWNVIARRRLQTQLNRLVAGYCPNCGYNLCATPQRCPECGWTRVD